MNRSIWIGFDPRESAAYAVARNSILEHLSQSIPVRGVILRDLQNAGLYTRPTDRRLGRLYDELSATETYNGEMSTEFAIARFLVPALAAQYTSFDEERGWALFMDCDVLVRTDLVELFKLADPTKAVMCVKHRQKVAGETKMDGRGQSHYARKNWTSVMMFNLDHVANKLLSHDLINNAPGRELHRFCWLADCDIGELGPEWNCLVGETEFSGDPKIAHFTLGGPWFSGFENVAFADEWRSTLDRWAA